MRTTGTATIELDPRGIVITRIHDGVAQSLEDARANMAATVDLCGGSRLPLLVDISRCKPLEPEVRHFYSGKVLVESFVAHELPREPNSTASSTIGIIQEEVRHANTIVTALLDYARVKQPTRRPVALSDVIERVLGARWIPATVSVARMESVVPLVHADADQLHDALLNLVLNAVEAMPEGGKLVIELTQREGWALLAVTDTGPGIPSALEPRLFEPLHSTKPMGVGLGLVTARTFVEAHGGRIASVRTERGARFEIRIPLGASAVDTSTTLRSS